MTTPAVHFDHGIRQLRFPMTVIARFGRRGSGKLSVGLHVRLVQNGHQEPHTICGQTTAALGFLFAKGGIARGLAPSSDREMTKNRSSDTLGDLHALRSILGHIDGQFR